MAVTATYDAKCSVTETLATNVPAAQGSNANVTHTGFNTSATLTSSSSPAASKVAAFQQSLSTGTATVDLTSLTGTNGASVDGTGLMVQIIKVNACGLLGMKAAEVYNQAVIDKNPHIIITRKRECLVRAAEI